MEFLNEISSPYNQITSSQRWEAINILMNLSWDLVGHPKLGIFLWLDIQKRILIEDRIRKMGFEDLSRCTFYKEELKVAEHLLYQCKFTKECWIWLKIKLNWTSPLPKKWQDHLIRWPKKVDNNVYGKFNSITLAILVWEIWKEH